MNKKITILGDGGWGTTLSLLLAKKGIKVNLWGVFPDYIDSMKDSRENSKFLPGLKLPNAISLISDIEEAVKDTDLIVLAIPSKYLRNTLIRIKGQVKIKEPLVSVVKGIENETFKRPSEIIHKELNIDDIAVLSGPTIAYEIASGLPASAVVASTDKALADKVQEIFMTDRFRIYGCDDVVGVEIGGALKNIIAIAAGISDGLKLGANAKASLFTRGLVEMKRLGCVLGGKEETFNGLSGMGDLVTTCISSRSRNRYVGEEIAKGKKLIEVLDDMDMVAEGVETARSVYGLSKKLGVDMPITDQVYQVLFEDKNPHTAVNDLMTRTKKSE